MNKYFCIFILALSSSAFADSLKDVEATKNLCQKAAEAFSEGSPKKSMDLLKPFWPLPVEEVDNLAYQSETQLKMVASRFGKSLNAEFISTKTIGNSFAQHVFIGKFEKHAIRYMCTFYKPKDSWLVNNVSWDDKVTLLF